jgi:hypothetical protein
MSDQKQDEPSKKIPTSVSSLGGSQLFSIADELTWDQLKQEFRLVVADRDEFQKLCTEVTRELGIRMQERDDILSRIGKQDRELQMLRDMLLKLLSNHKELRWRHRGMDNYSCTSCGSKASADHNGKITREESCSRSCPWRGLEEFYGIA